MGNDTAARLLAALERLSPTHRDMVLAGMEEGMARAEALARIRDVYDRSLAHESQSGMFLLADIRVLLDIVGGARG